MFLPRSLIQWIPDVLPKTEGKRRTAMLTIYVVAMGATVGLALFTQARTHFHELAGKDIVKRSYGRNPLILVRVNIVAASVMAVETPPAHVVWGDIPTPMF